MRSGWLREERASVAVEQILDAAGVQFAARGVDTVGMAEVAAAAGCSRATLYRYFENRETLRAAFVHREARRVASVVSEKIEAFDDPGQQLIEAISLSLQMVRNDPILASWFAPGDAGNTARIARSSDVIGDIVAAMLGDHGDPVVHRRAQWVVRVIVSLLTDPEADAAAERTLIEEFVVPVVLF